MATLYELVNQIPGIDPEILTYVSKPFKPTTCDPVVITDVIQNTTKYCAPTTLSAELKAAELKAAINKTQKILDSLSFSAENPFTNGNVVSATEPYNDACSAAYIKAITDLINNDIIPKNNASQEKVSKLPIYIADFWNTIMLFIYGYVISYKMHSDNNISDDDFNNLKSIFPTNDSSDNVSLLYKSNLSRLISAIESSISSVDIGSYITNPLTIPDMIISGASDIGKQFDNRISSNLDGNKMLSYSMGGDTLKSGVVYDFSNTFPIPTDDQIKTGKVKPSADTSLVQKAFDSFYSTIDSITKYAAVMYYYGKYTSFSWSGATQIVSNIKQSLNTNYGLMLSAYDAMDGSKMETYTKSKLTAIKACGQTVVDTTDEAATDTSLKDINHKTYSKSGQPDFTQLKYWKVYSKIINTIGLLPMYWRVGLLIPTPAGILKIPVPIIWKPLVVIPTPLALIVIFITIDGMIVSPVVWTLIQKPIANAESKFLVLFRGANQSIKTDTGVKMLNLPVVGGEDINPALSRILPFEKDDLPSIERTTILNSLLLVYINKWLSVATQYLGIP